MWKFLWMCGQYGGGAFVVIHVLCLIVPGLPVMTMELSLGRAAQASPIKMMRKLKKPGQKWHVYGTFALLGESVRVICLDTFVAIMVGLVIFPACFTYNNGNVNAGRGFLFDTMAFVFVNMEGGRVWGTIFSHLSGNGGVFLHQHGDRCFIHRIFMI